MVGRRAAAEPPVPRARAGPPRLPAAVAGRVTMGQWAAAEPRSPPRLRPLRADRQELAEAMAAAAKVPAVARVPAVAAWPRAPPATADRPKRAVATVA